MSSHYQGNWYGLMVLFLYSNEQ